MYVASFCIILPLALVICKGEFASDNSLPAASIYDFQVETIDGEMISMSQYKGKVLVIVNVASACGLAIVNYRQLQNLYSKYEKDGLKILAFPSTQFVQEINNPEFIKTFAALQGATFDLFNPVDVNGDNTIPLYKFLKDKLPGYFGGFIEWNYVKFLVDRNGNPVERYSSSTPPKVMESDIIKCLNSK